MAVWKKVLRLCLKTAAIVLLLMFLIGGTVGISLIGDTLIDLPKWQKEDFLTYSTVSTIYDFQGKPVANLRGKIYRVPVALSQVSPIMQDAIIAVEDERFYDHRGIDYWGLGRALANDLRGSSQEGASTITQQLVKNVLLTPEKSLNRKLKEAVLARRLEDTFSKREILELYLNYIYFGEGAYGIEAASQTYFAKPSAQLTLPEAAVLAGLPKNPSRYSPLSNPADARQRRNTVLQVMLRNGYISQQQMQEADAAPLPAKRQTRADDYPYPFFLDHVIEELSAKYGLTQDQIYDGGLHIYTTLDPKAQQILQQVYAEPANFPAPRGNIGPESAAVILEPKSGYIKALVGGRSYSARRGYNRATMLRRQPGSTLKPLVVYAPAIERGYGPATILDSSVETYGDTYSPENFGNAQYGRISMRTALSNSVNTYAVKLLKLIGVNEGYNFGKRLGLSSLNSQDKVLGLALGGVTQGLSPLELAAAYAPLANRGTKLESRAITKVVDGRGKVLVQPEVKPTQVMQPETADMITDLLKSAVDTGTGQLAKLEGQPVAGKTGTTQLPELPEFARIKQGNKDAWFAGYTPDLLGVVWLGYDITDSGHYLDKISGGSYPALIWNKIFSRLLAGAPPSEFHPPPANMLAAEKRVFSPKRRAPAVQSPGPPPEAVRTPKEDEKQDQGEEAKDKAADNKPGIFNKLLGIFRKN